MCFIQFSMAHWKKRGIFMVENQVFGRAGGVKYNKNDRYTVEKYFSQCKFGEKQGGTL